MTLAHKSALIAGAATGIGRATAKAFAAAGASLVLADVNRAELAATVAAITDATGARCLPRFCDVSSAADVAATVDDAVTWLGGLDIVVNSAGVQRSGAVEGFDEADWDLMVSVNAKSCFLLAKYATGALRSRGGGSIVNIASIAGVRGGPGQTAYSASKGAIIAFSRALATELAPNGIRVNSLAPGWVDTPFNEPAIRNMGGEGALSKLIEASVPLKRQGTVDEIAQSALFLASDASSYITGQTLIVDGGTV